MKNECVFKRVVKVGNLNSNGCKYEIYPAGEHKQEGFLLSVPATFLNNEIIDLLHDTFSSYSLYVDTKIHGYEKRPLYAIVSDFAEKDYAEKFWNNAEHIGSFKSIVDALSKIRKIRGDGYPNYDIEIFS